MASWVLHVKPVFQHMAAGFFAYHPSSVAVILSLRRIWRAEDMNRYGSCGGARKILQD
jgi:hypothetical protein